MTISLATAGSGGGAAASPAASDLAAATNNFAEQVAIADRVLSSKKLQQISAPSLPEGAVLNFGPESGTLVDCWDFRAGHISRRLWSECCTNRSDYPPPRRRPWCWPLQASPRHWSRHVWTFERCCEHRFPDTMDGLLAQHARHILSEPGRDCEGPMAWVCDVALERTRLARLARRRARALLAGGQAPSVAELRRALPVLGFPVSHDADGRFTLRLLRSIDFPVARLVLVLNTWEAMRPAWLEEALLVQPSLEVVVSGANLGCAGGWNSVIETVPSAPYWLICNNDVAFPPGALRRIAEVMAVSMGAEAANGTAAGLGRGRTCGDVAFPGCGGSPGFPPLPVLLRWFALRSGKQNLPAFALTRRAVAEVGLFDENFWPVYGEDEDYFSRLRILNRGLWLEDATVELVHGPEDWDDGSAHYSGSGHFISSKVGLDEQAEAALVLAKHLASADNGKAYCQKYGPIDRPRCFELEYKEAGPFGVASARWDDWILDPFRRMCIMSMSTLCGYDLRLLHSPPSPDLPAAP